MVSSGGLINEERLLEVLREVGKAIAPVLEKYDLSDADYELLMYTLQVEYNRAEIRKIADAENDAL